MKEPKRFEIPELIPVSPKPTSRPAIPREDSLACLRNKIAIAPIIINEPKLVILPMTKKESSHWFILNKNPPKFGCDSLLTLRDSETISLWDN